MSRILNIQITFCSDLNLEYDVLQLSWSLPFDDTFAGFSRDCDFGWMLLCFFNISLLSFSNELASRGSLVELFSNIVWGVLFVEYAI